MNGMKPVFAKEWTLSFALLLFSLCIYFVYFHNIFLNLNSTLSSITLDSIKNYYTFVYHIKNDTQILHFTGMNYPFGEHVIYTDCQPLLTFILRPFKFLHNHLIGIMHGLLYFTFIITPVILHKIFISLSINRYVSFFVSMAIALLSPQLLKINAGHHALAYGCVVPVTILMILNHFQYRSVYTSLGLLIFLSAMFLLHPYLGFSLSLFSSLSFLFYDLSGKDRKKFILYLKDFSITLLPVLLFKLFMLLTDKHKDRTIEPYGNGVMVENIDSLVSPVFGPFRSLMESVFNDRPQHFEGHTYLGFFILVLFIIFICMVPKMIKWKIFSREVLVLFLSSLIILFISFGYHNRLFEMLNIKISAISQFRAVCRFAWIFYFTFSIFVVTGLYQVFRAYRRHRQITLSVAVIFFLFNLFEAHYYFKLDEDAFWKFRNFFSSEQLNKEERDVLGFIDNIKPQAILPLPMFHGGSEMYDRNGSSNEMIPSMVYSYHASLPIIGVMMSRTSMTETEQLIQLFNSYKKNKVITEKLTGSDLLVFKTAGALLPDEERLAEKITPLRLNDSILIGKLTKNDLMERKITKSQLTIRGNESDSLNTIYIKHEARRPFISANMNDYEKIYVLDSNKIKPGTYVVSFHYYYTEKIYQSLSTDLIIIANDKNRSDWLHMVPLRKMSGFYSGYGVFEYKIEIKSGKMYEFVLKGRDGLKYKISDFMLRPAALTVYVINAAKDSSINNFSIH